MLTSTVANLPARIAAMSLEKVPTVPVEAQAAEVRRLGHLMVQDRPALLALNMPEPFFETPAALALHLETREGRWIGVRFKKEEAAELWKTNSPRAYEVRDNLLSLYNVAFIGHPDQLRARAAIAGGRGHEDMLLDIFKLVELGRANLSLLEAVNSSAAVLDAAESLGRQCAEWYAMSRPDGLQAPELIERDKAKVFAAQWMTVVRTYGKRVSRGNPERVKAYQDRNDKRSSKDKTGGA